MRALYFDGSQIKFITDYPKPTAKTGESLLKINLAAVCNTDKEVAKGYKSGFTGVMGHEFVGTVVSSPNESLVGKLVVGELNSGCGECIYCKTNRASHCENRCVLGMMDKDGCFAEYMTIDTKLLHAVPSGMSAETAIFAEPLAAALEITELSHFAPSTRVAVIGDGRLSFMISQVLALTGARITVFGKHPEKLKEFEDFAEISLEPTGSFETVVDATGSPAGFLTALRLVRSRGLIVVKSTYAENLTVNFSEIVVREITVKGSRCGPFEPALSLLKRGLVRLPAVLYHDLEDYKDAFGIQQFKSGFKMR